MLPAQVTDQIANDSILIRPSDDLHCTLHSVEIESNPVLFSPLSYAYLWAIMISSPRAKDEHSLDLGLRR